MSARVYLFADFGKGPRVEGRWNSHPMNEQAGRRPPTLHVQSIIGDYSEARAWWLVECESAEHGRRIISAFVCGWPRNDHEYGKDCWVLANGGAK